MSIRNLRSDPSLDPVVGQLGIIYKEKKDN